MNEEQKMIKQTEKPMITREQETKEKEIEETTEEKRRGRKE